MLGKERLAPQPSLSRLWDRLSQENANYTAHYQTNGYHPLVAFDSLARDFLKAELRYGNVYTSNGVGDFVRPLFEHYQETIPVNAILVRADSGFTTHKLYSVCEDFQSLYVNPLKSNRNLGKITKRFIFVDDNVFF
nr:transposase [Carnobacterium iners]